MDDPAPSTALRSSPLNSAKMRGGWFIATRSGLWRGQVLVLDVAKLVGCLVVLAIWIRILLDVLGT